MFNKKGIGKMKAKKGKRKVVSGHGEKNRHGRSLLGRG